jgi:hypothetical protein
MSVHISLSKTIYPQQCLESTKAAYSSICLVKVVKDTSTVREVEITPIQTETNQPDEDRTAHEFLNHLLDLSVEHHLQKD